MECMINATALLMLAKTIITHSGIRGTLPLTVCVVCLTLMWLEAVLGLCLGCEIHGALVRRVEGVDRVFHPRRVDLAARERHVDFVVLHRVAHICAGG